MLVLILLLLSACGLFGSYYEPEPVGIGRAFGRTEAFALRLHAGRAAENAARLVC